MKNSDSKNSLAELNPQDPICFVCLEEGTPHAPLVESSLLRSCGCKFHTHTDCWNQWIKDKGDYDCPYCGKRTLFLSIPMTAPLQQVHILPKERSLKKKILYGLCILGLVVGTASIIIYEIAHS